MPIEWDDAARQLHLRGDGLSYVIRVLEDGSLGQVHVGSSLAPGRSYAHLAGRSFHGFANRLGDPVRLEYPTAGIGDYRVPALVAEQPDGSTALRLAYADHEVRPGKPASDDLPTTYVEDDAEADTVEVRLVDGHAGLEVHLRYTVFADRPVVARGARLRNTGERPLRLTCAMSALLDLPDAAWTFVHLSGSWARERHVHDRPLAPGRQSVSSSRGASSHQHNPFVVLARPTTTEEAGEAIGFALVYSGNFLAEVEVDHFATTRVRLGIDPETFAWTLGPGEALELPEAIIGWSDNGLGALSDAFHGLFRDRLARGPWRDRPRPIVINNWEATYFAFDEDRLVELATAARDVGVELFVLDDGWFGARDDDTSSLGDWEVDRRKLPNGLDGLARRIEDLGLGFGLWIEPEMISERSGLYAAHPDWAIGIPGRPRTPSRQQLVLDMTRPEVVDHLARALSEVLASAPVSYVKWDMNRMITEPWTPSLPPARQGEFFHRYIVGVYELYERLRETFPDVLFESCAGGGGRFDPGLLAYAPQAWTSDDTDAVERLRIQWGTSLGYPLSAMAAHVSAVPNHQVGRVTPLATRAAVAFFGVFGYELDLTALADDERREIAGQVAFYKRWRELFQRGRFVRLRSPFEGDANETAWLTVSDDRRTAIAGHYLVLNRPAPGPDRLRLRGLDPEAAYRVTEWPEPEGGTGPGGLHGGDELMAAGLVLDMTRDEAALAGDFRARLFVLEAV